ncbi:MAG: hypothetical protein KBD01_14670 [Acidobacteria bacterium]|nr:hypothetical protein [Acidobacteriota bacterium]
MSVGEALARALSYPTAAQLRALRAEMLEAGVPAGSPAWLVLDKYHAFLGRLESGTTSREYSELASKLDIASISGVLLEHVLEPRDSRGLTLALLTGAVSEGLMALATRQHVKAWEEGLASEYRDAAWFLYGELWRWAEQRNPGLSPAERRRLLDRLFGLIDAPEVSGFDKALFLGRLFQILLASYTGADR